MSHFSVLVIGENIEEQLAPFNEASESKEYLVFKETETEMLDEYATQGTTRIVMPDGSLKLPWDDCFRVSDKSKWYTSGEHKVPEHIEQREVPYKETYATFEDFVNDWHGSEERDPEQGVFGYWHNPQAKWDWYEIGGRWTGYFHMKPLKVGTVGRPGLMTSPAEAGHADQARKGDIDFDAMRDEAELKARLRHRTLVRFLGHIPVIERSWKSLCDDESLGWEERRGIYHTQPDNAAIQKVGQMRVGDAIPGFTKSETEQLIWLEDLGTYCCTEDEYAQRARNRAISTFALVKGSVWYEKGEMGWWGVVRDPKDENEWINEFNLMLDGLDDNTILTVVDCHI